MSTLVTRGLLGKALVTQGFFSKTYQRFTYVILNICHSTKVLKADHGRNEANIDHETNTLNIPKGD